MSCFSTEVGRRIRAVRRASRTTFAELAERAGVSEQTLRYLESGERDAYFSTVAAACDALGIDMHDLVAGLPDVRDERLRDLWRSAA